MNAGWHLAGLPLFSAGVAVLELDTALVAQWLVSRPLVVGPLVGWLAGDLETGIAMGALTEVFCLEELPVGSVVPPNGAVAAAAAVLLSAGPAQVALALALPLGLAAGAGHVWVENRVRSWRAALTARAAADLAVDGQVSWAPLWRRSLGVHWAATALYVYASVALGGLLGGALWSLLPEALREGFGRAWAAVPFLAAGSLLARLWR